MDSFEVDLERRTTGLLANWVKTRRISSFQNVEVERTVNDAIVKWKLVVEVRYDASDTVMQQRKYEFADEFAKLVGGGTVTDVGFVDQEPPFISTHPWTPGRLGVIVESAAPPWDGDVFIVEWRVSGGLFEHEQHGYQVLPGRPSVLEPPNESCIHYRVQGPYMPTSSFGSTANADDWLNEMREAGFVFTQVQT